MSHTPFIVVSYLAALVLMAWSAIAPIMKFRSLRRQIAEFPRTGNGDENAPDS